MGRGGSFAAGALPFVEGQAVVESHSRRPPESMVRWRADGTLWRTSSMAFFCHWTASG